MHACPGTYAYKPTDSITYLKWTLYLHLTKLPKMIMLTARFCMVCLDVQKIQFHVGEIFGKNLNPLSVVQNKLMPSVTQVNNIQYKMRTAVQYFQISKAQ